MHLGQLELELSLINRHFSSYQLYTLSAVIPCSMALILLRYQCALLAFSINLGENTRLLFGAIRGILVPFQTW